MSKEKKQTFLSFLKEQDPKTLIYLGTENGSSWIVIEPASVLIDRINDVENLIRDRVEREFHAAEESVNKTPKVLVDIHENIAYWNNPENFDEIYKKIQEAHEEELTPKLLEQERQKKIQAMKSSLHDREKHFANAVYRRAEISKRLQSWKKIGKREIVETYVVGKSAIQERGIAVKVEGNEAGTLWWRNESKTI